MALCLGEIPSIAFTDFLIKQKDIINRLSSQDLASLFSIFTSIRLPEESRVINIQDLDLNKDTKHLLKKVKRNLDYWKDVEIKLYNNVDNYDIHFDLCEIIYKWCSVTEGQQYNIFEELKQYILLDNTVTEINYPVSEYPKKINSTKLDRTPRIEGELKGIKGQYLIFDAKRVFNMGSHEGYISNVSYSETTQGRLF